MQKYGLIGYPLKHSFSIGYFNEKFHSEGIDTSISKFQASMTLWKLLKKIRTYAD